MRFRFVQDDDCHWYLIPANKIKSFDKWIESVVEEEEYDGETFWDCAIGCSPSQYTFVDPKTK